MLLGEVLIGVQLCPNMTFAATPPYIYGTLARYCKFMLCRVLLVRTPAETLDVLPADMVHPIPDSVSFEDGAMMEPLSVGVHSVANLGEFKSDQVSPCYLDVLDGQW